jgi:CRP-like cAMP-binding protein
MLNPDPQPAGLTQLRIAQVDTSMPERAKLLERAAWVRRCELFGQLSVAESAMLCTLMERIRVPAGQPVLRQGTPGDAIYLVEAGRARVEIAEAGCTASPPDTLGPGQCCGHQAVLTDGEHSASIVATTDMTLLRLSKRAHDTYLAGLPDVGNRLTRHALRQLTDLTRIRRRMSAAAAEGGCGCAEACACATHPH